MVPKYILDSSYLIALYLQEDVNHTRALEIFKIIKNSELYIHTHVIAEVVTILTYRMGQNLSFKFLVETQSSSNIHLLESNISEQIEDFKILNKKISFTDSVILAIAKRSKYDLVTFDKQMLTILNKK